MGDTKQQKGVAQCINRTLLKVMQLVLSSARIQLFVLPTEALKHTSQLMNRLPLTIIGGQTLLDVFSGLSATDSASGHIVIRRFFGMVRQSLGVLCLWP